jgi:hypothetical protein
VRRGRGGGIFVLPDSTTTINSTATLTNCTLSNDTSAQDGGGIFVDSFTAVTLTNCTLNNDSAPAGGGVFTEGNPSTLTRANRVISNDSGGGVYNTFATVTLADCTLANDSGSGGLVNQSGTAMVTGCTVSNYSALECGGMQKGGTATLTNCTINNDSASSGSTGGGVIWNAGGATLTLTNCTLANNAALKGSGGGIWNAGGGTLDLTNTLVAENTAAAGPDVFGGINTADHDLIGDGSGMSIITNLGGNLVGTSTAPIDPGLGPLQNNGGPTQTLALLADSPAIGHGDSAKAPATDQRGIPRLDETGEATDIGAFEF